MTRLTTYSVDPTPALDLYAGEHWDVARRLAQTSATGTAVKLWVCSAGYGLIPATAPIVPYSATFSAGNPDSVPHGTKGATAWWDELTEWMGPTDDARSLRELVGTHTRERILLVLSASYLKACRNDIVHSLDRLTTDEQLSIISAGTKADAKLENFLLPCDARLQTVLGGTRQSLNVRTAEFLISAGTVEHDEMTDALERLLAKQPALIPYTREPATDAQVRAFIRSGLNRDPSATHTRLLREFRQENRACEQARFAASFAAVTRRIR